MSHWFMFWAVNAVRKNMNAVWNNTKYITWPKLCGHQMLSEEAWAQWTAPVHPQKCSVGLRTGLCANHWSSSSLTYKLCLQGPCFVHIASVILEHVWAFMDHSLEIIILHYWKTIQVLNSECVHLCGNSLGKNHILYGRDGQVHKLLVV